MKFPALLTIACGLLLTCPRVHAIELTQPLHRTLTVRGVTIQAVLFDSHSHSLRVLDQTKGPGSVWLHAQAAAQSVKGLAAINAGYFTPEGQPLGVVIADGQKRGSSHGSSLGSGVWYEQQGKSAIVRRERSSFRANQLIQAGPMLTENAKAISGLDATKISARSFIAWNGAHTWFIARTTPCDLAKLSSILASQPMNDFRIVSALNLDGGTSADLYVGPEVTKGPAVYRALWNKPVRNFLVLQKR